VNTFLTTSPSLDECSITGFHWLTKEDCHVILFTSNSQHLLQILGLTVLCEDKVVLSVSFSVSSPPKELPGLLYRKENRIPENYKWLTPTPYGHENGRAGTLDHLDHCPVFDSV